MDARLVDKDILRSILGDDKAETLFRVEPFHSSIPKSSIIGRQESEAGEARDLLANQTVALDSSVEDP